MTGTADPLAEPVANILLVDDQPANLLALEAVLQRLGQRLVKALSGAEALRCLLDADFAVVLLDVQMQGLDGFETAKLIRGRDRSRHTPIIFLTAYQSPDFPVVEAYKLGAVDYLVKPLVPEILRAKVAGFVELFQKTEQVKRQAEQLRHLERREFERQALAERACQAALNADVSATLAQSDGVQAILQRCSEVLVHHLDAALARIWTPNPEGTVLELQASAGMYTHLDGAHSRVPIGQLKIGLIAQEKRPLTTNAVADDPRIGDWDWVRREGLVAFAGYPLLVEGRLIGVMALFARHRLPESTLHGLASVADGIAQCIERKRAEEALRVSRERLDLVLRASEVGLWYCDLPFDRLVWNARCKEHFGLLPDAEITIDTFYECLHADDRERARQAIEQSIAQRSGCDIQYRTVAPDGRVRWVRAIGHAFDDATGRPARFDGITVDVTTQKQAEEALREADRRKDQFLAMLAHELRNPLAPVLTGLYLARQARTDGPVKDQALATAERQVRHLARLVEDLLDVSRLTRGQVQLRPERLDLARLVRTTAEDRRSTLDQAGLILEVDTPATPAWLVGDATRLAQVLHNLLDNAAKFTARGGRVAVRLVLDEGPRQALLSVRDTGSGIEPAILPRLFDVFAQGDRGLDRTPGGLGLGLSVVKGLVELHGGEVQAASAGLGRGAEFTVRLPLQAEPAALSALSAEPQPSGRPRRILVIEDNRDAAQALRRLLEVLGHEVAVAFTGPEGLKLAGEWRPDVVVSDIGLPGLDGYEVARRLRRQPGLEKALLVALTGYGQEEDRHQSREAGFHHHLVKPADPAELQRVLARGTERVPDGRCPP